MPKNTPLVLMILDGFGYNEDNKYNAIAQAHKPQWDAWWQHCPHALLSASGEMVGLPPGQMGNSEVGHMHIGAGRVIQQNYTRINTAISENVFKTHHTLNNILEQLEASGKALHMMGLLSPGGVHSHEAHLFALLAFFHQRQFNAVNLHLFLDGRDCPPQSAMHSLERLNDELKIHPTAKIRSISGRFYAMDRDKRWERVQQVYDLLTEGGPSLFDSAPKALLHYYQEGITDEFIPPTAIGEAKVIEDGDVILYFNFRADRARALTEAFVNPEFDGFIRSKCPQLANFISMTEYDKKLRTTALFLPIPLNNTLGELICTQGLKQLRIAETEKYAHVTFFLNGGKEEPFFNEERVLIPSPKITTYNLQPEMSAFLLTECIVNAINKGNYNVIICNYANADMVGHTGDFGASVAAIECLDKCMQLLFQAIKAQNGVLLITADHGNAEIMFDENSRQAHTAHTSKPVPFLYVGKDYRFKKSKGSLIDVAPTILTLLGIPIPAEMTGENLLEKNHDYVD